MGGETDIDVTEVFLFLSTFLAPPSVAVVGDAAASAAAAFFASFSRSQFSKARLKE